MKIGMGVCPQSFITDPQGTKPEANRLTPAPCTEAALVKPGEVETKRKRNTEWYELEEEPIEDSGRAETATLRIPAGAPLFPESARRSKPR